MSTKKIPIDTATATQLAEFASVHLGLDVNFRTGVEAIRGKMAAAGFGGEFIEVEEQGQPTKPTVADVPEKMVKLIIPSQDVPGGSDRVFLSVNGKALLAPRDEEITIAYRYFEALRNAETYVYEAKKDGGLSAPRRVPAYPYNVLGGL